MATILDYLSSDHRVCDDLLAASIEAAVTHGDWDSARRQFDRFLAAMRRHLAREEVLFSAFETRTANDMGPTRVMRMEHEQIRGLMQDMACTVADADHCRYVGLSETLRLLVQHHKLKEEDLLFPLFDQMLAEERAGLIDAMQAIAP